MYQFGRKSFKVGNLLRFVDKPTRTERRYAGIGASVVARIKNTKMPFSIDFGVGDVIVPKQEKHRIHTQLDDFTK